MHETKTVLWVNESGLLSASYPINLTVKQTYMSVFPKLHPASEGSVNHVNIQTRKRR